MVVLQLVNMQVNLIKVIMQLLLVTKLVTVAAVDKVNSQLLLVHLQVIATKQITVLHLTHKTLI